MLTIGILIILLFRLEWVQSIKVADENEDCNVRHLEIVCKFGSAPRNAEIIKFFGEDILPFIVYKEGEFLFLPINEKSKLSSITMNNVYPS